MPSGLRDPLLLVRTTCRCGLPLIPSPSTSRSLTREFSQSPSHERRMTSRRRDLWQWINGPGAAMRHPIPGKTNYLGNMDDNSQAKAANKQESKTSEQDEEDQEQEEEEGQDAGDAAEESNPRIKKPVTILTPFPLNLGFRSEGVLSTEFREAIYSMVVKQQLAIREVSMKTKVDMRRIAAVVRLMTIEKNWEQEGKPLAIPYSKAVLAMLPQTSYRPDRGDRNQGHESINDLPVHAATGVQIFHPVSESRQFTRADAGRVFKRDLLPADDRIPHPQMIQDAVAHKNGASPREAWTTLRNMFKAERESRQEQVQSRQAREDALTTVIRNKRGVEFRFRDFSSQRVGKKGGLAAADNRARYGAPHMDRKKGMVKIPTRVV